MIFKYFSFTHINPIDFGAFILKLLLVHSLSLNSCTGKIFLKMNIKVCEKMESVF